MKNHLDFVFQIDACDAFTSGIYAIVNTINDEKYIGSTNNFRRRYFTHRATLKKGVHYSPGLQALVNEHGLSVLKFQRLESCAIADLPAREDYYLAAYLPAFNTGLGFYPKPMLGKNHSDKTKALISSKKKGKPAIHPNLIRALDTGRRKPKSMEAKQKIAVAKIGTKNPMYGKRAANAKAVIQLDTDGNFIARHESFSDAMIATGAQATNIKKVCAGKRKVAGGFVWKLES